MKILVIEDNNLKFGIIATFLKELFGVTAPHRAASFQAGVSSLIKDAFDWVILDMTLPVSDLDRSPVGMDYLPFGGQYILRECRRKRIKTRIIVVTQYGTFVRGENEITFQQLSVEILSEYSDIVLGCIRLDSSSDSWKAEITSIMQP